MIPGNKSPILCNDGKIKTSRNKREIILKGCLPYLELVIRRSNHAKKGNKAIKVYLREKRQIENVRKRGARVKQSVANQRLR